MCVFPKLRFYLKLKNFNDISDVKIFDKISRPRTQPAQCIIILHSFLNFFLRCFVIIYNIY